MGGGVCRQAPLRRELRPAQWRSGGREGGWLGGYQLRMCLKVVALGSVHRVSRQRSKMRVSVAVVRPLDVRLLFLIWYNTNPVVFQGR